MANMIEILRRLFLKKLISNLREILKINHGKLKESKIKKRNQLIKMKESKNKEESKLIKIKKAPNNRIKLSFLPLNNSIINTIKFILRYTCSKKIKINLDILQKYN